MAHSGRPVSFWMRHEFIDEIDKAARAEGVTRTTWVVVAIRQRLAALRHASSPSSAPE